MAAEEIELKLRVQESDLPKLRALLTRMAGGGKAARLKLTSLYFDTPHLDLLNGGTALRVRRVGRRWVQTLKGGGKVLGGLHARLEQESNVPRPMPDISLINQSGTGLNWDEIAPQLVPVFSTEFQRTLWQIDHQGSRIEAALDQGMVHSGEQQEALLELELELKSGQPSALHELALELAASLALAPDPISKAERGYRLFHHEMLVPAKATIPAMETTFTVEDAFIGVMWNCLDQLQRNQRGVAEQTDPEFIHQMRVALRRLRSALSLFSGAVRRESWEGWSDELRWLAGELGTAREWDVLEEELLPPLMAYLQGRKPLEYLPGRVHAERLRARRRARTAVLSPRYGVLALSIECWLNQKQWREGASDEQLALLDSPVHPLANVLLQQRHDQLHRRGRHLVRQPDAKRHRARVTAKKLRYALEFFASLYPRKAAKSYLNALASLQDALGTLNDEATALQHAAQLCAMARSPRCAEEAGILSGWCAARMSQQLQDLGKIWKAYLRQSPYWN